MLLDNWFGAAKQCTTMACLNHKSLIPTNVTCNAYCGTIYELARSSVYIDLSFVMLILLSALSTLITPLSLLSVLSTLINRSPPGLVPWSTFRLVLPFRGSTTNRYPRPYTRFVTDCYQKLQVIQLTDLDHL